MDNLFKATALKSGYCSESRVSSTALFVFYIFSAFTIPQIISQSKKISVALIQNEMSTLVLNGSISG